jgi:hypothetical protein
MKSSETNKNESFTRLDISMFAILFTLFVVVVAGFIAR